MLAFDHPAEGVVDQGLITPLARQVLEVFDDGGIQHDVDELPCTAACHSVRLVSSQATRKRVRSKSAWVRGGAASEVAGVEVVEVGFITGLMALFCFVPQCCSTFSCNQTLISDW